MNNGSISGGLTIRAGNHSMDFYVTTDQSKFNIPLIHDYLSNQSYWAKGRSIEAVQTSIENSLGFGVFDGKDKQVGFARVVTDRAAFAYLMDVFVLEAHRAKGIGELLMKTVLAHPDLQVKLFLLGTVDAHEFYTKFGFGSLSNTERYMELRNPDLP